MSFPLTTGPSFVKQTSWENSIICSLHLPLTFTTPSTELWLPPQPFHQNGTPKVDDLNHKSKRWLKSIFCDLVQIQAALDTSYNSALLEPVSSLGSYVTAPSMHPPSFFFFLHFETLPVQCSATTAHSTEGSAAGRGQGSEPEAESSKWWCRRLLSCEFSWGFRCLPNPVWRGSTMQRKSQNPGFEF